MDIKKCIKKINSGDQKAMAMLYEKYKNDFYYTAIKYSKSDEDAQDIIQDTFITVFNDISKYRGSGTFEGWMKRILINKAISRYKSQGKFQVLFNENRLEDVEIEDSRLSELSVQELLSFVRELPNQYRLVFNLYELDDLSHDEISELLGISQGTSKSNLHRAKVILKEKVTAATQQDVKKHHYGK
ncbi:hypothetical protein BST97_06625 [Nonlabens spongiae]|uniref:RNA polymerase subunit sigma-70 n=1 Tax=Nonlabens spongiae TaxID=331648 RepID=A0A1W6MJF2_9FLAO|nr:sigma-70 family RNA polymerase sigma factor [Nonlabens spongiae]ARN77697.1 hypothetical protein BST97_06625 [Nonlabens spongiae]